MNRTTSLLLNAGHAIDHMFLLIFAACVSSIAQDFGFSRWEDLMPYSAGAFFLFGIGSVPSGRLGDLWGRRRMMLVFFFGMGAAALLTATVQNAWQLAAALTLLGAFASIYHPVGIPMLVRHSPKPGFTIGVNGLAGNLGIAVSAMLSSLLAARYGWRAAFIVPGLVSIMCGLLFARYAPGEKQSPAHSSKTAQVKLPASMMPRLFVVMTLAAATSSFLFNLTTNGNGQLLSERFAGIIDDPARLGLLLAAIYVIASLAQLVVGTMIDRFPMKRLYLAVIALQIPLFLMASGAQGWALFWLQVGIMVSIFGAIPFVDALIVRYVDDAMRSRVTGMRLAVSFSISSLAVWLLGPMVKLAGFAPLLAAMAGVSALTFMMALMLPSAQKESAVEVLPARTG